MDKTIEIGEDMILITEVVMDIIWEVIKGMGDRIIIITIEGETLEIKLMIEIGVGPTKDKIRDGRDGRSISNSRSRSGSRWLQIEIGLDALNAGNMIISQGTVW